MIAWMIYWNLMLLFQKWLICWLRFTVICIAPETVMVFMALCKCRFLLVGKRYVLKSRNNKLNKYFFSLHTVEVQDVLNYWECCRLL